MFVYLEVGCGQDAQDVHDELLQHALVAGVLLQRHQPVQHDQLHVVVGLLQDDLDVGRGRSLMSQTTQTHTATSGEVPCQRHRFTFHIH